MTDEIIAEFKKLNGRLDKVEQLIADMKAILESKANPASVEVQESGVEAQYEVTRPFDWGSDSFKIGEQLTLNPEDPIVNGLTMSNKLRRLDRIRLLERKKELANTRGQLILQFIPMAYTTVANVQALVGDIVPNRQFSPTSRPTLTEVNSWVSQIQSEMQLELLTAGFISGDNELESTHRSYGWLNRLATVGVSARILQSIPMQSIMSPDMEDAAANRAVNFDREYHRGISKIRQRVLQVTDSYGPQHVLHSGSSGDDKKPFFKRGQFDYPGIDSYKDNKDNEEYGNY